MLINVKWLSRVKLLQIVNETGVLYRHSVRSGQIWAVGGAELIATNNR